MSRVLQTLALLILGCVGVFQVAAAQHSSDWDATGVQMTRAGLEDLLQRLDESAHSSAYSPAVRARAVTEAAAVRARLAEGDFQVGDRIRLRVDGEPALTDTFTIGPGRMLTLPLLPPLPMTGVLRSELEAHLGTALATYIKGPVVHAQALIRVAVLGEVGRPGFYTFPSVTLVTDAIMMAGGPTHDARVRRVRIMRADDAIWDGAEMEQAIVEGRTLDQLSLVAGDRIEVPRKPAGFFNNVALMSALAAFAVSMYGLFGILHL